MLYREIIAVCSQIHTKHINVLWGQNVQLLNAKLAVHIVTTVLSNCYSDAFTNFYFCPKLQDLRKTVLDLQVVASTSVARVYLSICAHSSVYLFT
jgi:hypothetical protein